MAYAADVPVMGLTTRMERPGLILSRAVRYWCFDIPELLNGVRLWAIMEVESAKRRCRVCGCTDDHACPGGCSWVEEDLCSACVGKDPEAKGALP